jgi:hypothetical protein
MDNNNNVSITSHQDKVPVFNLYRDPKTSKVLSRYQILLKFFREKRGLNLNQVRITLYTMRTDEQTRILREAVNQLGLLPFEENKLKQLKQLKL